MLLFWDCLKISIDSFKIFWLSRTDSFKIPQIGGYTNIQRVWPVNFSHQCTFSPVNFSHQWTFLTSQLFSPVNWPTVNFSPQSNFTPQLVSPVSQRVALEVLTQFSFWNRIFSLSSNHGYKYNFARIQRSHLFNWLVNCNAMHSLELSQFRVKRVYLEMLLWQKDLKDYNYNHAIWFYK